MNDELETFREPRKWIKTIVAIVLVTVILIILNQVMFISYVDDWDYIKVEAERVEDGWIIHALTTHYAWDDEDLGFPFYEIGCFTDGTGWVRLDQIDGKFDRNETLIYFDVDDNDHYNIGDVIFVYNPPDRASIEGSSFVINCGGRNDIVTLD